MNQSEFKSLEQWRFELKRFGRKHWYVFYQTLLDAPVSNFGRFNKTIALYGEWPVFEAIVATSNVSITGDPLSYVIAVAQNKWKEEQKEIDAVDEYQQGIDESIAQNKQMNQELEKKLAKARRAKC